MIEQKNITDKEHQDSVKRGAIILINVVIALIVLSVFMTHRYMNNRYKQLKQELIYAIAGNEDKRVDIFKIEKSSNRETLIFVVGE